MKNKTYKLIARLILLTTLLSACYRTIIPAGSIDTPVVRPPIMHPTDTPAVENIISEQASSTDGSLYGGPLQRVTGDYIFSEGPAADENGNIYFSDINAGRIYKWMPDGSVTIFFEGLNKPNGLALDGNGSLIVCEGGNGRLISIDSVGQITVLVDQFNGVRFNEPNDLWIDSQGGIYFTDPAYQSPVVQDGEHVYYLSPDRAQVIRVINDMVRPNGIVGTADGEKIYVTDNGAGQTFTYTVNIDGTLTNKQLFVSVGSDGMELDASGNLYLTTTNKVQVFDAGGNFLREIATQENPTNVAFGGTDHSVLFITARTQVYTSEISAPGSTKTASFTLTSPDLPGDGRLPAEYTCDGASSTLALAWSGAPAETQSYAVVMHHNAPDNEVHWYWVVYDIPADVTSLPENMTGIGILGTNSVNDRNEYTPPCSKGPDDKEYIYTVYALSAQPQIAITSVNRAALLDAIKDITLASAEMTVVYARP